MADNFLAAFAPFARQPQQQNPMDVLAAAQENYPRGPAENILQQLAGGFSTAPSTADMSGMARTPNMAPEGGGQPRQRRSLLDIIGRASDVVARVGGAEALYQPTLDAYEDRAMGKEDRDREIDMDGLRRQLSEQQLKMGGLQITDAENALDDHGRERIGMALGGIVGAEDPAAAWREVGTQSGLPPEKVEAIAQALEANPEIAGSLAQSFGFEPPRQGSQAKEMQIYSLLLQENPELAPAYLQSLTNPDAMTPYQQAQLGISLERLGLERDKYENPPPSAAERTATAEAQGAAAQQQELASSGQQILTDMRDAFNRLRDAGGINAAGQNVEQRAGAWALENLPGAERMFTPEGFSAREDINRLRTVGIPSLLPLMGGLTLGGRNMDAAKELDTWQKAIASASDYESAMNAIDMIEGRIRAIQARPAPAPAPAPSRRSTPAPAASSGGRTVREPPAVGGIHTRADGSRWKRTGPGRYDWERVN